MKTYRVDTTFAFYGKFFVIAKSAAEAKRVVKENCTCLHPRTSTVFPSHEVAWDFSVMRSHHKRVGKVTAQGKQYAVETTFTDKITFWVNAESKEKASKLVIKNCRHRVELTTSSLLPFGLVTWKLTRKPQVTTSKVMLVEKQTTWGRYAVDTTLTLQGTFFVDASSASEARKAVKMKCHRIPPSACTKLPLNEVEWNFSTRYHDKTIGAVTLSKDNRYAVETAFCNSGTVWVCADNEDEARQKVEANFGQKLFSRIQTTLPPDKISWKFARKPQVMASRVLKTD